MCRECSSEVVEAWRLMTVSCEQRKADRDKDGQRQKQRHKHTLICIPPSLSPSLPPSPPSRRLSLSQVVVNFSATWCAPCTRIAPELSALAARCENARFRRVDVDEVPELADKYQVKTMPSFVFVKEGDVVGRVEGAQLKQVQDLGLSLPPPLSPTKPPYASERVQGREGERIEEGEGD